MTWTNANTHTVCPPWSSHYVSHFRLECHLPPNETVHCGTSLALSLSLSNTHTLALSLSPSLSNKALNACLSLKVAKTQDVSENYKCFYLCISFYRHLFSLRGIVGSVTLQHVSCLHKAEINRTSHITSHIPIKCSFFSICVILKLLCCPSTHTNWYFIWSGMTKTIISVCILPPVAMETFSIVADADVQSSTQQIPSLKNKHCFLLIVFFVRKSNFAFGLTKLVNITIFHKTFDAVS